MKGVLSRRSLILIAIIISIVMYLAGVFSGLYANNILEEKVNEDISQLKETLDNSALDIKNLQLQQLFIDNFETENRCDFLTIYLNHLYDQLRPYWDALPSRLESYERGRDSFPQKYITMKREYMRLSLRIWLISKKHYKECGDEFIPILYFYTKDCQGCVEQGESFDTFNREMKSRNKTLLVFPVDAYFEDDTIYLLKKHYNITTYPAIIARDEVFQGEVLDSEELDAIFRGRDASG